MNSSILMSSPFIALTTLVTLVLFSATLAYDGDPPPPLVVGTQGVVIGTTGKMAVEAGVMLLKQGGSAVDAAMGTALAQVVECAGAYVSHAGILSMVYFEATTGKVYSLNACYQIPAEEKDPLTIPGRGKPSGRTALVPGYMAGIQAAHDRFGKLSRQQIFAPAIAMAQNGVPVTSMLARFIKTRSTILNRLPNTAKIFKKDDGSPYIEGDNLRQAEMAHTLQQVAKQGAKYMYEGVWGQKLVADVQMEGGKLSLEDLKKYQPIWENPLHTSYRNHEVYVPGMSSIGGVNMIEAMHLLKAMNLPRLGHFTSSPESLFWLMQAGHCQALGFLPRTTLAQFNGLDLTPHSRLKQETAEKLWQLMQQGKWPLASAMKQAPANPAGHSDGVVAVDSFGNVAAVTHTINTVLWGDTGIFVDGISIPDSAAFQQAGMKDAGAGNRLPDPMCPLIVMKDGKPLLASSAIGGGLHQRTLGMLCNIFDFGYDPQAAIEAPYILMPEFGASAPTDRVEQGSFHILEQVIKLGQPVKELSIETAAAHRGYWIGVHITPQGKRAIGTRKLPLPSVAGGY
jgi:gamma-glutamyltranspeptidase/glutathione hydrolase